MSEDINRVTIVGNLVKDAELKYTNSGTAITKLTIAVNRSVKQGENWTEEASFFDVSLWGKRGESLNQYLQKGSKIGVDGFLKQDRWEKDGEKLYRIIIQAENIQLFGSKQNNGSAGKFQPQGNGNSPSSNKYNSPSCENTPPGNPGSFEDGIPF